MIKNICIQNLKALRDTGNVRTGMITILTGINGRGKSSFLQSLLLLSQSMRLSQGDPRVLFPNGDWCKLGNFTDLISKNANTPLSIEFQTDSNIENDFSIKYIQSDKKQSIGEAVSCKIDGQETISQGEEHGVDEVGVPTNNNHDKTVVTPTAKSRTTYLDVTDLMKLQHLYYISSNRIAASNDAIMEYSLKSNYLGESGQYLLNVLAQCSDEQINEIETQMSSIMDGASMKINTDAVNGRVYLYLDSEDNGNIYRPVNVGYGFGYIISTILSTVLAKSGEIVIIENPEAHLHPQAQSRLMKYLISVSYTKNVQFFIETHSDHIVNASLLALKEGLPLSKIEILYFDRSKESLGGCNVQNLSLTKSGRVIDPPKGFCDQYAIDLRKIMRPSYASFQHTKTTN